MISNSLSITAYGRLYIIIFLNIKVIIWILKRCGSLFNKLLVKSIPLLSKATVKIKKTMK